jgi:hypothetical protein
VCTKYESEVTKTPSNWSFEVMNDLLIFIWQDSNLQRTEPTSKLRHTYISCRILCDGVARVFTYMLTKCKSHIRQSHTYVYRVQTFWAAKHGMKWYKQRRDTHFIFIGPCIAIYSYGTTNKIHLLSQIIYSCKTLYMFRTVFPSIIRSSKLQFHLIPDNSRCLAYTVVVYGILSSWWWMERPSETCRTFYKNK